jgi:type IV pilus assembly protein PilP
MFEKNTIISSVLVFGLVCAGMLSSLAGCDQAPPPPPTKVEKTEPPPPKAPEESEAEETEEAEEQPKEPEYEYDSSGRREPFASLVADDVPELPDVILTPDPVLLKTPLQKFEVNTLKVTGIILGSLGDYARIEAPDGKSYTINVGTLVGMHEGEVSSISENSVVVRETIRYESGKVEELETPLYLNPVEEEEN